MDADLERRRRDHHPAAFSCPIVQRRQASPNTAFSSPIRAGEVVGHPDSRHTEPLGLGEQRIDLGHPVEHRVLGVVGHVHERSEPVQRGRDRQPAAGGTVPGYSRRSWAGAGRDTDRAHRRFGFPGYVQRRGLRIPVASEYPPGPRGRPDACICGTPATRIRVSRTWSPISATTTTAISRTTAVFRTATRRCSYREAVPSRRFCGRVAAADAGWSLAEHCRCAHAVVRLSCGSTGSGDVTVPRLAFLVLERHGPPSIANAGNVRYSRLSVVTNCRCVLGGSYECVARC